MKNPEHFLKAHIPKMKSSKQYITGHKMFGKKKGTHGTDLKIGMKFRESGSMHKGTMHTPKTGDIGPSVEEFENMISGVSKKKKSFAGSGKSMGKLFGKMKD